MQKSPFSFSTIKFKTETLRFAAGLIAGMALVLGTPFVFAAPTATPPSGTVTPNFSAIAIDTYTTAVDYNASSGIWVGSASKTTGGSTIPTTSAYVYAISTGQVHARSYDEDTAIYGININWAAAGAERGGIAGVVTSDGESNAKGYLGYLDTEGDLYGLYTDGAAKVGSLYIDGPMTTTKIFAGDDFLDIYSDTIIHSHLDVEGKLTANHIGYFEEASGTATSTYYSVNVNCPSGYVRVACGGLSTTNNFLGSYPIGDFSCAAQRSSTSGTLTGYAYCFNPTITE